MLESQVRSHGPASCENFQPRECLLDFRSLRALPEISVVCSMMEILAWLLFVKLCSILCHLCLYLKVEVLELLQVNSSKPKFCGQWTWLTKSLTLIFWMTLHFLPLAACLAELKTFLNLAYVWSSKCFSWSRK